MKICIAIISCFFIFGTTTSMAAQKIQLVNGTYSVDGFPVQQAHALVAFTNSGIAVTTYTAGWVYDDYGYGFWVSNPPSSDFFTASAGDSNSYVGSEFTLRVISKTKYVSTYRANGLTRVNSLYY